MLGCVRLPQGGVRLFVADIHEPIQRHGHPPPDQKKEEPGPSPEGRQGRVSKDLYEIVNEEADVEQDGDEQPEGNDGFQTVRHSYRLRRGEGADEKGHDQRAGDERPGGRDSQQFLDKVVHNHRLAEN